MKRLEVIRSALKTIGDDEELCGPSLHISKEALARMMECLNYLIFPEYNSPPERVVPAYLNGSVVKEWTMGKAADIMSAQLWLAFLLEESEVNNSNNARTLAPLPVKVSGTQAPPPPPPPKPKKKPASEAPSPLARVRQAIQRYHPEEATANKSGSEADGKQTGLNMPIPPLIADGIPQEPASPPQAPSSPVQQKQESSPLNEARSPLPSLSQFTRKRDNSAALKQKAEEITREFLTIRLAKICWLLRTDAEAIFESDVAATSLSEVILCYPSIACMLHQRVAHQLYLLGAPTNFTRSLTEMAHARTGIDIHPMTSIGHHFVIDHGTGIVIGATAIIGNYVNIYQGVTLGAKSFPVDRTTGKRMKHLPRHPIIEDDVTIYANAVVLGRVTIGRGSTIGGNCWVVNSLPPHSSVVQKSNRVLGGTELMFMEGGGSGI